MRNTQIIHSLRENINKELSLNLLRASTDNIQQQKFDIVSWSEKKQILKSNKQKQIQHPYSQSVLQQTASFEKAQDSVWDSIVESKQQSKPMLIQDEMIDFPVYEASRIAKQQIKFLQKHQHLGKNTVYTDQQYGGNAKSYRELESQRRQVRMQANCIPRTITQTSRVSKLARSVQQSTKNLDL